MTLRHPILQSAALLIGAAVCALVANAAAPRQRQLVLVGNYPNALRVPARSPSPLEGSLTASSNATARPTASAATEMATVPTSSPVPPGAVSAGTTATSTAPAETQPPIARPETAKTAKPIRTLLVATDPVTATKPLTKAATPPAHADVSRFAPHPDKPYIEIAGADVAALHSSGALFLDARRTSVYEQGHIGGARPISVWESDLDEKVRKLFDERSDPREQAKPVVIYCSGGDCEDSHMLAEKLWGIQFNNVYVYKDGFPDWQKRGGMVHTGSAP